MSIGATLDLHLIPVTVSRSKIKFCDRDNLTNFFLYSYYCFDVKTKSSDDRKQGILTCIQVIFLQKTYKTGIKGLIKNPKLKSEQTAFIKRNCDRSFSFTSEIKTFYRLNKMIKALWSPLFILIFSKSIK